MVNVHEAEGYEEYSKLIEELEKKYSKDKLFILFSGSLDEGGASWCIDCREAEPVLESILKKYEDRDDLHYIHVSVGDRPAWKDPKCSFRTDPILRLKSVPTLIHWGSGKRLEESECKDEVLVELVFEGD